MASKWKGENRRAREAPAVLYHRRMLEKYKTQDDAVQGREWLDAMIDYHRTKLIDLGVNPDQEA